MKTNLLEKVSSLIHKGNKMFSKPLEPLHPSDSKVVCTHLVLPPDTNSYGNAFGGRIMAWMDIAAGIAAAKHCKRPAVTVAIDNIHFAEPIHLGDVVVITAQVDYAGKTSMEVGISVDVDDIADGTRKHCLDGFFTFVALGQVSHSPVQVPQIIPTTPEEEARWKDADLRRTIRNIKRQK